MSHAPGVGGQTPLDPDEAEGLLPSHIATQEELNAWEAENIARGMAWARARRPDPLDVRQLAELHRRMFDVTWAWAGTFRRTDKNISPHPWPEVPRLMLDLVRDTAAQRAEAAGSAALDDIAIRFHHRLVVIHPWPNGNGRHARLAADVLIERWGGPPFTWGRAARRADTVRARYLSALRAADAGDLRPLLEFARG